MSSLTPNHKFLLDENVKTSLLSFLESSGFDAKFVPKTTADLKVAAISKEENRILITNDEDFQWYNVSQIYGVILLKVPQNNTESLLKSFAKLLSEFNNFSGRMIVLEEGKWKDFPLFNKPIVLKSRVKTKP